MPKRYIIIIGAGLAGLSAGCYAQMNGYETQIFEMHNIPGGLCTSWKRKGYTFDGCIHYLMGSRTGLLHKLYEAPPLDGNDEASTVIEPDHHVVLLGEGVCIGEQQNAATHGAHQEDIAGLQRDADE